jgi:hypothetical protein
MAGSTEVLCGVAPALDAKPFSVAIASAMFLSVKVVLEGEGDAHLDAVPGISEFSSDTDMNISTRELGGNIERSRHTWISIEEFKNVRSNFM